MRARAGIVMKQRESNGEKNRMENRYSFAFPEHVFSSKKDLIRRKSQGCGMNE